MFLGSSFNTFNACFIHIDRHQCICINYIIIYSPIVFGALWVGEWHCYYTATSTTTDIECAILG